MKLNKVTIKHIADHDTYISDCDESIYPEEKRQYDNGEFEFIGITAEAEIISRNNVIQYIQSGGIWGVHDNDKELIEEYEKAQLAELDEELAEFGLSVNDVDGYETKEVDE